MNYSKQLFGIRWCTTSISQLMNHWHQLIQHWHQLMHSQHTTGLETNGDKINHLRSEMQGEEGLIDVLKVWCRESLFACV